MKQTTGPAMRAAGSLPVHGEAPAAGLAGLPLAYFASAVLWFGLGAAGLVVVGPDLARGNLFAPRVIAVTHGFTLGVLTHTVMGALHQFLPAVVGIEIRHRRTAQVGLLLFLVGTPLLVGGFWWWRPSWQAVGWFTLFVAVGAVSMNLLPARRRSTRNRYVGGFVSLAHSALGMAMVLGAARIGHALGWWEVDRLGLVAAHFHLGALGFGTLTVVAIGSKMLPAFLGARIEAGRRIRAIGWLASVGLTLFTAGAFGWTPVLTQVGEAGMVLAAIGHLWLLTDYFRLRRRGTIDPGLGFVGLGMCAYASAIVVGIVLAVRGGPPDRLWALYVFLAVVGWLSMLILGVMHRVAPRLIVLWMAGRRRPLSPATQSGRLLDARVGWGALVAAGIGVVVAGVALGLGVPDLVRVGAASLVVAAALVGVQALRLGRIAVGVADRTRTPNDY